MVILSYEFALLFIVFFCVYWLCRRSIKTQNYLLIIAGLLFVASWDWKFIFSLLFMWQATQICAYIIDIFDNKTVKKISFAIGILVLLAHLVFFKYSNFFISEVNDSGLLANELTPLDIIMPLGVSFYSFQAISYLTDVYQQKIKPVPSHILLGILSFIPTLTAGPIFRVKDAMYQWEIEKNLLVTDEKNTTNQSTQNERTKTAKKISRIAPETSIDTIDIKLRTRRVLYPYLAATLIMFALAKKVVLAGWLETIWVNPVFANPFQFNGLEVITAVYAYSLQLFFDFSGYTDLAIALGLLLGFRVPENFRQPYLATDIQDFWKRWHITLSTWIRDYLYIPLGGNRRGFWRVQVNLMLAFVLSGVWHGAGWNFFIWGAIHGVAIVWLNIMNKVGYRHKLTNFSKLLAIFLTFNYVAFGWVFFHSKTFEQSRDMLVGMTHFNKAFSLPVFMTLLLMAVAWWLYPHLSNAREMVVNLLKRLPWWTLPLVFSLYVVLVFSVAPAGLPGFIYANF